MSEQCKNCKYFNRLPIVKDLGECQDPSKYVVDVNGNTAHRPPEVYITDTCIHFKTTH